MERKQTGLFYNIDWWMLSLYIILVLMGWFNIYAAVYNEDHSSIFDISQNYGKQLIWIVTAAIIAMVILLLDEKFFTFFAYPIYVLMILILLGVLAFGVEINGSKSWFAVGEFRIQPAEFAKFATAMALAKYLSNINTKMENLETKIIAGIIIAIPPIIILLQNETGSALVFAAFIFVLYREGLSGNVLLFGLLTGVLFILSLLFDKYYIIIGLGIISGIVLLLTRKKFKNIVTVLAFFALTSGICLSVDYIYDTKLQPHQRKRIDVLLGKETDLKGAGYNVNQSKIAIGSGGFWGKGFLQGTQTKYDFVPEQSTDFIFCTIGEEWGFVGSFIVITLMVLLMMRIVYVAERQRSQFSRIYGYGVASILFFHFVVNIGMTIGLAPVIGIPLPFFSYGGSSLWSFTILLFIFIKLDANRLLILR